MCTSKVSPTIYDNGKYVRKENWTGMNWISQTKRYAIYMRDNFTCIYCGAHCSEAQLSLDHVKPCTKATDDSENNLVTACSKCNSSRGDRSIKDFSIAVALYVNHGTTPESIVRNIKNSLNRKLNMSVAKLAVKTYGSCKKALTALPVKN